MDIFFIASFFVSRSHDDDDDETFVKENRWFRGRAIVESVRADRVLMHSKTWVLLLFPTRGQGSRDSGSL